MYPLKDIERETKIISFVGFVAGGLATVALVPQVVRVFKLKSAREISTLFTLCLITGMILFLIYGILLGLVPLIIWNTIGVVLTSTLLYGKWKYGKFTIDNRS